MLKVGGFTPLSTTDWPGQLAAVVFVQGCPWRCHYCHNADLQCREGGTPGGWLKALGTLARRQGLLDAVVFSGGEPTLDPELPDAIETVRSLGFKVGLHTAGIYPDKLQAVLPMLDWVGFDIKTDFAHYEDVTATSRSGLTAWRSLQAVLQAVWHSGLQVEVRTTYHPALQSIDSLENLAATLDQLGVTQWVLQAFRPSSAAHEALAQSWVAPNECLLQRLRAAGPELELALR